MCQHEILVPRNEGSGEPAQIPRLARAFAAHIGKVLMKSSTARGFSACAIT